MKTIDTQRHGMLVKVGARNNADATRFAIRCGLVPLAERQTELSVGGAR